MQSPAFPRILRIAAAAIMAGLLFYVGSRWPALRSATWSTSGVVLWGAAALIVLWTGWWIVRSRTCLESDEITQTWLWNKRVHARNVAQIKLVHWPALEWIMAPRMLIRQRSGVTTWIHAADARVLTAFANRVPQNLIRSQTLQGRKKNADLHQRFLSSK